MKDSVARLARLAAADETFQALARAALKTRARNLQPGDVVEVGNHNIAVQEDESGEGIVVQSIVGISDIETLVETTAIKADLDLKVLAVLGKAEFMQSFITHLRRELERWQGISMRMGPGENITFEMAVYKKDESWR